MKEVLVISGKGGTGKTTLVSVLAELNSDVVVADCDVDAPDLHLVLRPEILEEFEFRGGEVAYIDKNICDECGICVSVCEFNAISDSYVVDGLACEGCWVCQWKCPLNAITMKEKIQGKYFISSIKSGKMVHAELSPAEENSGKLVSTVKKVARDIAQKEGFKNILIDGSPGIGCPVIASIAGANLAVIVTEPTVSGIHDFVRVNQLCEHFKMKSSVVINKFDLNVTNTGLIENYCREKGIDVIGKIPFSEAIVKALIKGQTILEYEKEGPLATIFNEINNRIWEEVNE